MLDKGHFNCLIELKIPEISTIKNTHHFYVGYFVSGRYIEQNRLICVDAEYVRAIHCGRATLEKITIQMNSFLYIWMH